jgi:hypothetical protein
MEYRFLVTVRVALSPLGFEYNENGILETPTKIAEVKNFIVTTDEGYNKAYFAAINSICEYVKRHYENQDVRFTVRMVN